MPTQDGPDQFLSEYFGTDMAKEAEAAPSTITNDDVEMISALTMLEKDAAERGIDLSQHSQEEILKTAAELYMGQAKVASDEEREYQEWFELQKYAGKIHAHSFMSEMDKIAEGRGKAVREGASAAWDKAREIGGRVLEGGKKVERTVSERAGAPLISRAKRDAITEAAGKQQMLHSLPPGSVSNKAYREAQNEAAAAGGEALSEEARKRGRMLLGGAAATGTAATAGGTAAVMSGNDKKASDVLKEQMMVEMLADAGYVDNAGNILPPPGAEKTAADQVLDALREEALSELYAAGYR